MRICNIAPFILLMGCVFSVIAEDTTTTTISVFTLNDNRVIKGEVVREERDSYQVKVPIGNSHAIVTILRANVKMVEEEVIAVSKEVVEVDNSPEGVFIRSINENVESIFEMRSRIEELKGQIEEKESDQRDIVIRYAGPFVRQIITGIISNPPENINDIDDFIRIKVSTHRLDLNRISKYRDALRSWNYFAREISSMGRVSDHMLNHLLEKNRVELREMGLLNFDHINVSDRELRMVVNYIIVSMNQEIETEERLEREKIQRQLEYERKREEAKRKREEEAMKLRQRRRTLLVRQLSSPIGN